MCACFGFHWTGSHHCCRHDPQRAARSCSSTVSTSSDNLFRDVVKSRLAHFSGLSTPDSTLLWLQTVHGNCLQEQTSLLLQWRSPKTCLMSSSFPIFLSLPWHLERWPPPDVEQSLINTKKLCNSRFALTPLAQHTIFHMYHDSVAFSSCVYTHIYIYIYTWCSI